MIIFKNFMLVVVCLGLVHCLYLLKRNNDVKDFVLELLENSKTEEEMAKTIEVIKNIEKMVLWRPFRKLTLENFLK